jgi:diacylglycerol kinase family enzyme
MQRLRIAVLLNASAGTIAHRGDETLQDAVASAFEKHPISLTIKLLSGADLHDAAELALRNVADGECDAIVVGGGDGSIRTVASVLAGTGVPLGIIPLGTLNHFAKDLGLPSGIDEIVAIIVAGETRDVDVGEVNGEIFINNSSIGIYPSLVFERERRQRRAGLSKWMAMLLAGLRVFRHLPLRRLAISAEGWIEPVRSPCVFIGNNEYHLTASAFGKREKLDGAELYIYVAKVQDRLALLWLACRAILGRIHQCRDLRVHHVSAIEIRSRASRLLVALDGEVRMIRAPLRYKTRPGALRVVAPPVPSA